MTMKEKALDRANPYRLAWLVVLLALATVGVCGAYQILVRTETAPLEWGLLVPCYVFFALAATGSSLVNSLFTVFGVRRFKPMVKRGVLLSLLLIVPPWINKFYILDLKPVSQVWIRFIYMRHYPNLS